jgi:copper transport protein
VRSLVRLAPALAALLAWPSLAAAHGVFVSAEPAPGARLARAPATVRVALSAPLETAFLRLVVSGPGGRPAAGPARRDPIDPQALAASLRDRGPGTYRVAWRALSQDGHPSRGTFAYAVGSAPAPPRSVGSGEVPADRGPLAVAARLAALVGPLGLLGLVVMRFAVAAPAWRDGGRRPPGSRPEPGRQRMGDALGRALGRWWTAWWALLAVWFLALVLGPVALLRGLGAGAGDLGTLLTDTRWGRAWIVQAIALVVCALAAEALRRHGDALEAAIGWGVALGAPAAAAAVAVSWSGHASSGSDRGIAIGLDATHNLATAAWLGGLVALQALVPAALRGLGEPERVRLAAGVVVRFSALAIGAVAVLAVTGTFRALGELSSLQDLVDTAYGRALTVKLAIFAVMLGVGGYNRFVVHPRLERAALGLAPDDRGAAARLRDSVAAELVLAAALMTTVAVLVSLPPPT